MYDVAEAWARFKEQDPLISQQSGVKWSELLLLMEPLPDVKGIWKHVLKPGHLSTGKVPKDSVVSVHYTVEIENSLDPADSTVHRKEPLKVDMQEGGILKGMKLGIQSMTKREIAVFIIRHEYAYGSKGIAPRIPPCALVMVTLEVLDFYKHGTAENVLAVETSVHEMTFRQIKRIARKARKAGCKFYKRKDWFAASLEFEKGLKLIKNYRLKNEEEQKQMEKLLIKLLLNQAACGLRTGKPELVCLCCREILEISSTNYKTFYRFGRAKLILEDYEAAIHLLNNAAKLKPGSSRIYQRLDVAYAEKEKREKTKDNIHIINFSEYNSGFSSDDEEEEDDIETDFETDIDTDIDSDIDSEEDKPVACVKDVEPTREMLEEINNPKMPQRHASLSKSELSQSSSVYKTANEPGSSISSPRMGKGAKISIQNRQNIKDLVPRKNSGNYNSDDSTTMSDISSPVPFPATSLSYNAPPSYPSSQAPSIYPSSTPPASCAPSYCPSSPLPSPPSSFLLSVNAPSFYPSSIVDSFLNPSLSSTPIRSSSSVSITPSQPLPFVSITESHPFTSFNPPPSSPPICPSQYSFPPASATHLPASSQNIIIKPSLLESSPGSHDLVPVVDQDATVGFVAENTQDRIKNMSKSIVELERIKIRDNKNHEVVFEEYYEGKDLGEKDAGKDFETQIKDSEIVRDFEDLEIRGTKFKYNPKTGGCECTNLSPIQINNIWGSMEKFSVYLKDKISKYNFQQDGKELRIPLEHSEESVEFLTNIVQDLDLNLRNIKTGNTNGQFLVYKY